MEDFKQLEQKFERTAVKLVDYEAATGVLHLGASKSSLHVSTAGHFTPQHIDENGWFNLRLRASDGSELLIHHAVQVRASQHGMGEDAAYTAEIFPNVVIAGSPSLRSFATVRKISFRLSNLNDFFYYRHAEALRAHDLTSEQKNLLEGLRYNPDWGPFLPSDIYVVHDYPEYFRFRVDNRTYSVWPGGSRTAATVREVRAIVYPVPTIEFDEAVGIQEALDHVWEWRAFFNQLAQSNLQFEALWLQGSDDHSSTASVYLPNLERYVEDERGPHRVSVHNLPLSQWEEREHLAAAMSKWLGLAGKRRIFRARLDRVLNDMARRVDVSDLMELTSAIESLDELANGREFPSGLLHEMAKAAADRANEADVELSLDRVRGVLGMLQRPSLKLRLHELARRVTPQVPLTDAENLVNSAAKIRSVSAHGASLDAQVQPRVGPTIAALAALCARFDLETAGVPSCRPDGPRTWPLLIFEEAMDFLRRLTTES